MARSAAYMPSLRQNFSLAGLRRGPSTAAACYTPPHIAHCDMGMGHACTIYPFLIFLPIFLSLFSTWLCALSVYTSLTRQTAPFY